MLCSWLHICNDHGYIQQDLEYNFKPSFKNVWEIDHFLRSSHYVRHVFNGESGHVEVNDNLRGLITYDGSVQIPEIDAPNPF